MTDTIAFEVAAVDYEVPTFVTVLEDGAEVMEDEPVVHAFGYDADGGHHHVKIRGFDPYFYVPYEAAEQTSWDTIAEVTRVELYDENDDPFRSVRGDRVARVVTREPRDVRDLRDNFDQHWESDVLYPTRFLIDTGVTSGIRVPADEEYVDYDDVETCEIHADWRIHVMDIEVDDRNGFPEGGDEPILCITAHDNYRNEYVTWIQGDAAASADYADESDLHDAPADVRWFDDEVAMLRDYLAYLSGSNPAIVTGWNVDGFDIPYLDDRCDVLSAERDVDLDAAQMSPTHDLSVHDRFGPSIGGIVVLDMLRTYKSQQFTEKDSYRLDAVADDEIGHTKEAYVGTIGDLWETDPAALVEYNLRDVELCVELDRREQLIAFAKEVKRFVGCEQEDAIISSIVADRYLLKTCYGDVVLPPQHSREGDEFTGATVFDAVSGLYEWVATLDLASLYPMSMLTLNASPETKVDPDEFDGPTRRSPNGIHFREDQDGITRDVIEELLEERTAKKAQRDECDPSDEMFDVYDRQQAAVKVIMNSLYGVMAWNKFRLYDVDVASAVTATGRAVVERTADVAENIGRPVLYGDTDSVLIDVEEYAEQGVDAVIAACQAIERQINAAYDDFAADVIGTDDHYFDIEFEKLYRRFFQAGKKKRYAGNVVWNEGKTVDSVSITGFEYKRSDCAPITNEVQHEAISMIVNGEPTADVIEYVRDQRERFVNRDVAIEDLGIPGGMNKELHTYNSDSDAQYAPLAAKYGNMAVGTSFSRGGKPKRYYLDGVNPALFDRLEADGLDPSRDEFYREFKTDPWLLGVDRPEQLPGEARIDWDEMEEKTFRSPIESVLVGIDVEWSEITSDHDQSGLDAFA